MAVHLAPSETPSTRVFYVSDDCVGPFRSAVERGALAPRRIVQVEKVDFGQIETGATSFSA